MSTAERTSRGRSATIQRDFTFTPTSTPTVALTRLSDGTTVATGSVETTADPTVFQYTIPASSNTSYDTYLETWTAQYGGGAQIFDEGRVEVGGGFLFDIDEARALAPLNNATTYPDIKLRKARTLAEQTIEDACGRAFVPRYTRETLNGSGTSTLLLSKPDLRAIRSVTVTSYGVATAYTAGELALLAVNPTGIVYSNGNVWPAGSGNVMVGYEHGLSYPPGPVSNAALILARSLLVRGPSDDRATGLATEAGFQPFVTAGRNGAWTNIADVNAVIDQYSLRVGVA